MRRYLAIFCLLAVTACAGTPQTRATAGLAVACGAIGSINAEFAPMIADRTLSDKQVKVVFGIRDATRPYCAPDSTVDPAKVVGFVEASLAQLRAIKEGL